jgi:creatinine amidohydrolase
VTDEASAIGRLLPRTTSADERERGAQLAVLPIGSFEQHGSHLPLATDTIIACAIARAIADAYNVLLLPPITISCSHEHADFPGTVSIRATTLYNLVNDIADSLDRAGIHAVALINGHGGNYVLSNVTQEANERRRRTILFPRRQDWDRARVEAGLVTDSREDMHGGELETSLLMCLDKSLVGGMYAEADHAASDHPDLLTVGMAAYTTSGIIGRPSAADNAKGSLLLASLARSFAGAVRPLGTQMPHGLS